MLIHCLLLFLILAVDPKYYQCLKPEICMVRTSNYGEAFTFNLETRW